MNVLRSSDALGYSADSADCGVMKCHTATHASWFPDNTFDPSPSHAKLFLLSTAMSDNKPTVIVTFVSGIII